VLANLDAARAIACHADLKNAPLETLCAAVRAQEANFVRGEASDGAPGLELFRRAIAERDEAAWAAVISVYRDLLVGQAGRQLVRKLVDEDDRFCVDRAFQRFWNATRPEAMQEFADLASVLKYLKMCLGCVLLDEARVRRRQPWVSLDEVPEHAQASADAAAAAVEQVARRELWQAINAELRDETERLLTRLSFVAGLTPREIQARYPDRFASVTDVYRLKRNVLDRLRRSPAIRQFVDNDSGTRA